MENYTEHAKDFLTKHQIAMTTQYLGHFPRLGEWSTSQWQVTFTRQGRKPFALTFSQSLNESWTYFEDGRPGRKKGIPPRLNHKHWPKTPTAYRIIGPFQLEPIKKAPSAYGVLACLTKSDPGTFNEFCYEYGYNNDSIKALETYRAVQEEWSGVRCMFGDCLEELAEIS